MTGKVLHHGQPLSGAVIAFHLDGETDAPSDPSIGNSKGDGTFSLVTGEASGAPAGKYTVTIICPEQSKAKSQGMGFVTEFDTQDRLKGAYADRGTSKISVEIKPGPNELAPFDLK